jgi:hypothetical protein
MKRKNSNTTPASNAVSRLAITINDLLATLIAVAPDDVPAMTRRDRINAETDNTHSRVHLSSTFYCFGYLCFL